MSKTQPKLNPPVQTPRGGCSVAFGNLVKRERSCQGQRRALGCGTIQFSYANAPCAGGSLIAGSVDSRRFPRNTLRAGSSMKRCTNPETAMMIAKYRAIPP
jgi:hypothetical protein